LRKVAVFSCRKQERKWQWQFTAIGRKKEAKHIGLRNGKEIKTPLCVVNKQKRSGCFDTAPKEKSLQLK